MNTMHVEDFIVLGRTVPEESKKYGQRICMAGYSPENHQLLRVYPLLVPVSENADKNGFSARHVYTLDLRRNEHDSRAESWRVLDEHNPTSTPWDRARETPKAKILELLKKHTVASIRNMNECKLSLGILILEGMDWEGSTVERGMHAMEEDRSLFEDLEAQGVDSTTVRFAPYIRFRDADGEHRLQVREWGANILLTRPEYVHRPEVLWEAAGYRRGKRLMLVIGNMCNHRANWLVIKTFEMDDSDTPSLF